VLLVSQKKKIVQEMLQAKSVDQIVDIIDRRDHGAVTNRLFLQKTNPSYLFWLLLQMQTRALLNQIHNSLNSFLLFLVLPITMVPISAGVIYFLGIALALISLYAVLSAGFQAYTTSVAFADLSQEFISKLELSATQDYDVKPITSLLQELGLNYDPEGKWLTDIIKNSNQLKDRKSANQSTILHALLAYQNPNHSYEVIKQLKEAILVFSSQKYVRNAHNETPMYVCNQTDMYGFKSLLDNQDLSLFQEQLDKIERFLTSVSINRKNTKSLLLLEGVSGTGKSQIVMDYIGKTKQFKVHRWEAGEKEDRYVLDFSLF